MKGKTKKVITAIVAVITTLLLAVAIIVMITVFVARVKGQTPTILGYSFHLVQTDSMTPEILVGDLVIAQKVDDDQIKVGDDIVFVTADPTLNGITIVHRVVGITDEGFDTCGIKEGATPDRYKATQILGKVVSVSTFGGKVFGGISDGKNIVFFLLIVVMLAIAAIEVVSLVKQVKSNKKQSTTNDGDITDNDSKQ